MRTTSACAVLTLVLCALPAEAARQPVTYRQVVERYRTSPNDGVERMLALPEAERNAGIERALTAHPAAMAHAYR